MPETLTAESTPLEPARTALRTARIIGLGHKLPDRVVANGPIAERIGVDSDWIVAPHRHPRAPLRRARTSARATSRSPPPAARSSDAGLKRPSDDRPRPRGDDDARTS